jgi:hypothetical protein
MPKVIGQIFLSSTYKDLVKYRDAVIVALQGLHSWRCVCMEHFTSEIEKTDDFVRRQVRECDLFVSIVGHMYGTCPTGSAKSFTEIEHEEAAKAGIPRLIFLAPDEFEIPFNILSRQTDEERKKQENLREKVRAEAMTDSNFMMPVELSICVLRAILNRHAEIPFDVIEKHVCK